MRIARLAEIACVFSLCAMPAAPVFAEPVVSTTKAAFTPYEHVIVTYSGLPTTGTEVVAVTSADDPDTIHPNMNFTNGRPYGKMDFDRFEPGTYEVRVYFSSDNVVQARHRFTVASPAGVPPLGSEDGASNATAAPGQAAAAADAALTTAGLSGGPPAGYYECYFYGFAGIQNSSMTSMNVLGDGRYEALVDAGGFAYDAGSNTLNLTGGGLAGLVAHIEQSDGKPAIVFIRKENEKGGTPAIDISDTWCYFEPR